MKLKVISLNLWFGGELFDAILDFLKKEKPDILACQEVINGQDAALSRRYRSFDVLKAELGYDYAVFSPAFFPAYSKDAKKIAAEWGNAIFSRFPILKTNTTFYDVAYDGNYAWPEKDFSRTPRNLQEAILKIGNNQLNFFNTQGIWGFEGRDTERRLAMAETIVNETKDKENVILTGDFNMDSDIKAVANIEKYLKNVFKNELTTTFNLKRKGSSGGWAKATVDKMFVSKNIKISEHYCPKADVSDHLPLVCVVDL